MAPRSRSTPGTEPAPAGASPVPAAGGPVGLARRAALVGGGLVCVAIGAVGIVVPGLPTTVFFIAAAWCFARSSPRLEQWVLDLPRIGPAVRRYRAGLGMPKRAKVWAIGSIVAFSCLSAFVVGRWLFTVVILAVAAIGVWYVGWRVPTTPDDVDLATSS